MEKSPRLKFLEVPYGDDFRIGNLKFNEENTMFEIFSTLASHLQPKEFPLGKC